MVKHKKVEQNDWFYPVILSDTFTLPSDEDYKTLNSVLHGKDNAFP